MITARRFVHGVQEPEPVDVKDLANARKGPGTLLIVDAVDFTDDELTYLADTLPIHPVALDDLRNANQRTKLERLRRPLARGGALGRRQGRRASWSRRSTSSSVRTGCSTSASRSRAASRWTSPRSSAASAASGLECNNDDLGCALWAMIDVIVDGYFTVTDLVDERLDDIEEIVFGDQRHDAIPQEVFTLRRSLVRFRRAAAPLREVLATFLRREIEWIGPEAIVLMQDVYDHSLRIADLIESQRDLLTGLLEAHLAVVSNRMNDVMKKTSSYGAILLVSTLIAGIYGMNFRYMPELDLHFGYFFALATMAIATGILWVQFKKRGWL